MAKPNLTAQRFRELYEYQPDSGLFFRRGGTGRPVGSRDKNGYTNLGVERHTFRAHRLAWLYMNGTWPEHQIDHINRNRSDNRIANLRLATALQNMENRSLQRNNKSGCSGVHFYAKTQKWRARIKRSGVFIELGMYADIESARAAYMRAKQELCTHHVT